MARYRPITPEDLREAFSALEGDLADLAELFAELSAWCLRAHRAGDEPEQEVAQPVQHLGQD
jgi:hypothetical protein